MVITVNLNPNMDRTILLNGFTYGGMNRAQNTRDDITSKGVNVSRVLKALGVDSICTGFMVEQNGRALAAALDKETIRHDYIWQPGCMRMNIKMIADGQLTEINDRGVPAKPEYLKALNEKIKGYAGDHNIFVFNGSMPPGCPSDYFAELIAWTQQANSCCVLDADGDVLKKGIEQKPYFVKVNKHELENYAGIGLHSEDAILRQSIHIVRKGVKLLLVSRGADGSLLLDEKNIYRAQGIPIDAVSPTGAGDSMVAAIVKSLISGEGPEDMLRSAAAASTATAMCAGTGMMTIELYNSLYNRVKIQKI